jgi:hypothetical protein
MRMVGKEISSCAGNKEQRLALVMGIANCLDESWSKGLEYHNLKLVVTRRFVVAERPEIMRLIPHLPNNIGWCLR